MRVADLKNMSKDTVPFEKWNRAVDTLVLHYSGMEWEVVLGDWMSRDSYDDGMTAYDAAIMLMNQMKDELADMAQWDSLFA